MAKKIRKARPSLLRVFVLLLIPWIVMAAVAAAVFMAGAPDYAAIVIALVASLAVTFYIRNYVLDRPRTRK